ncbi:hypothetical protein A3715_19205 [Oleiphilus sp. HI0009]|nr:hypothetical protein A3715_19205 [Oleiphilus sp. HI0009]
MSIFLNMSDPSVKVRRTSKTKNKIYFSVSEIAYFLAKPETFIKQNGEAYNKAAAEIGTKKHASQFKKGFGLWTFITLFICLSALSAYLYFLFL